MLFHCLHRESYKTQRYKTALLIVKAYGTYIYHSALKVNYANVTLDTVRHVSY